MKKLTIVACILAGISGNGQASEKSEFKDGKATDIKRVLQLVIDGRAEMQGRLPDAWEWRCLDKNGCCPPDSKCK